MMRLYPRHGGTVVDAPEGRFEAGDDGGFSFPGPLAERLHAAHHDGQKVWETEIERQHRVIAEEAVRRSDPRTMLEVMEQLLAAASAANAPKPAPAAKTAAKPAAAAAVK
jgi:hypothetical protein